MSPQSTYLTCWAKEGCSSQNLEPCNVTHDTNAAHWRTCTFSTQNGSSRLVNSNSRGRARSVYGKTRACPTKIVTVYETSISNLSFEAKMSYFDKEGPFEPFIHLIEQMGRFENCQQARH